MERYSYPQLPEVLHAGLFDRHDHVVVRLLEGAGFGHQVRNSFPVQVVLQQLQHAGCFQIDKLGRNKVLELGPLATVAEIVCLAVPYEVVLVNDQVVFDEGFDVRLEQLQI